MRLLLPKQDLDRQNQNIHKHKLSKLISSALNLSKENTDKLIHYDNPNYHAQNSPVGDYYQILEKVVHKFFKLQSSLTIFDVNIYIDKLAQS